MRIAHSILIALLVLVPGQAAAERLPFRRFTVAEGLSHNRLSRIFQDSQGFIWFCTAGGLTRFDGQSFVHYGTEQGLFHEPVNDLLEVDGTYWIATNGGGIVRFDSPPVDLAPETGTPFRSTRFPVGETPATNRVNVLFRDSTGSVWAGTDGGLFRRSAASPEAGFALVSLQLPSHPDQTTQIWALLEDEEKNLWIGSRFGLLRRSRQGAVTQYTIQRDATTDHVWNLLLLDGRLWLGHNSGLVVFKPAANAGPGAIALNLRPPEHTPSGLQLPESEGDARRYSTREGLPPDPVRGIVLSSSGSVWIGTAGGGVAEFRAGQFTTYTREHGLDDMYVIAAMEDRGGNIWMGTRTGAFRLARRGFVTYGEADGLGPTVGTVFERNGVLFATSQEFLVSRFDGGHFTTVKLQVPPGIASWRALGTIADRSGRWWLATRDGVFRYPRVERFEQLARVVPERRYTAADGLSDNDVARLFEDSRGDLWMAHFAPGENVLTRWERSTDSFHRYSSRDGLRASSQPSAFGESPTGDLWVGFRDGEVVRHHAGRFIQELPPDPQPERRVGAIYHDDQGAVWISVVGSGLVRIDARASGGARMRRYTTADGLASNSVGVLTQDTEGAIYVDVGQTSGIDRLDPRTGAVRHFTSSDGVPNVDYFSALRDRNGDLWFATTGGLIRFTPQSDPAVSSPDVRIGSLQIAGEAVPVHPLGATALGPFQLAAGSNRVTLSFFGLSPALDEGLRYQYRLEGADDDWSPPTRQRAVDYANLAAGRYRFAVRALNKDGSASTSPATVTFTILPPVWRRWWFLASLAVIVGLVARLVHQYQLRRAIELERVRMRIATDLHDDIGAGLSQVAVLSAIVSRRVGSDPAVAEPLSAIGELSRDLVDSMSDIVWAINPRRDHAFDLTHRMRRFASDVLGARDIDLTFTADAEDEDVGLGAEIRREVWLIFKESVNNVARHSGCTRAEITVRIAHQRLELTIADNGRGFSPDLAAEGHGLASIRQRAARIGAALEIESKPGGGTRVTVRAPIGMRHKPRKRVG